MSSLDTPVSSLEQLTKLKVEAHSNLLHGDFQGALQICHDVLQIIHRQPESTQHAEDQVLFLLMRVEAELRLGLFKQAREGLEKQIPPLLALLPEEHPFNITHIFDSVHIELATGNYQTALKSAKRLITHIRSSQQVVGDITKNDLRLARALLMYAHAAAGMNDFKDAFIALAEARNIQMSAGEECEAALTTAHEISIRLLSGDTTDAVTSLVAVCEKILTDNPTWAGLPSLYHNIAVALNCEARPSDAVEFLAKAASMCKIFYGEGSADYCRELLSLAQTQLIIGNMAECTLLLDRVGSITSMASDGGYWFIKGDVAYLSGDSEAAVQHYRTAVSYMTNPVIKADAEQALASALQASGSPKDALLLLDKLASRYEKQYGERSPRTASVCVSLGNIFRHQTRYKECLVLYERALRIFEETYGRSHAYVATVKINIGGVHYAQRSFRNALIYFTHVKAIREAVFGPLHPLTIRLYLAIAKTYEQICIDLASTVTGMTTSGSASLGPRSVGPTAGNIAKQIAGEEKSSFEEAQAFYDKALKGCIETYGPEAPETVEVRKSLTELKRRRKSW